MTNHDRAISGELGDFTATPRLVLITLFAAVLGGLSAYVAQGLLILINVFTNLFFFQRVSIDAVTPGAQTLGAWAIAVPIVGGLLVGLMARYGSERIRGHGIPEAIEAILINGSRVQPRVAILKPLSSAVSIGSGGPFGAEGPIIMTGGAIGSLFAQFCHLTSNERKTLLVAGAAAGMSATFAAPLSAVLLAVELLLFEWKPRSLIPVAIASVTAAAMRHSVIGPGPLFPVLPHPAFIGMAGLVGCAVAGLLAGILSALLTHAVYLAEDTFQRVPLHWMWWPALGGLAIGIGGWIFPPALGIGTEVLRSLVQSEVSSHLLIGILAVKSLMWAISLGSGTSGGVLAPLLMMGGALGGIEAWWLPAEGTGFWPLVSMGAILGGTMRSPLTGIVFAIELTRDVNMILPLLVAVTVAHAFTVLVLRRSILTEKVARRGLHLSREYATDPLETLFVRDVMRRDASTLRVDMPRAALLDQLPARGLQKRQGLYPVVGDQDRLLGVVTRDDLQRVVAESHDDAAGVAAVLRHHPVTAYPDESLRVVVYRMAKSGLTRLPVIGREGRRLVGMIALTDLLTARTIALDAEDKRERVFRSLGQK